MKQRYIQKWLCLSLASFSSVVWSGDGDSTLVIHVENSSKITPQSFSNASGRIAINQAAGSDNLQTNSHGIGGVVIITSQQTNPYLALSTSPSEQNLTEIESLAFENAQGLISTNQVSGQGNIQANLGAIALQSIVASGLDDSALGHVAGSPNPPQSSQNSDTVFMAVDSFKNAQGIVQVNQVSGDGNSAINQFSLQLPSGN